MTKLICPECQRENEAERIFCHDCGARLDRSGFARPVIAPEKSEQTRERVQRLFDPHRGKLRGTFFTFSKLILAAFVTAALVQMVSPLESRATTPTLELPAQINFELERAILHHRQLQYSQDQVNAYLAYTLKSKRGSLDKPWLTFKGATVSFSEGTCTITVERSAFSYSLFQRARYKVKLAEGKIVTASEGGSIGRLPIHPAIMRYAEAIFDDLWSALTRERKLVAQMATIEFHQGNVVLTAQQ